MAQPVVIKRLEAGVAACDSMEEQTQAAKDLLPDVVARIEELTGTIETTGDSTREALDNARAAVGDVRTRLEGSAAEARSALGALAEAGNALAEETGTLLEELKEKVAEVTAARERLLETASSGLETGRAAFDELGGVVERVREDASAAVERLGGSADRLGELVAEVGERLAGERQRWAKALSALQSAAETEAQDVDTRAMAFVQEFGTIVNDAAEGVVDDHNAALQAMWDGFAEAAVERLEAAFETTGEALVVGRDITEQQAQALAAAGREVAELMTGAGERLAEVGAAASAAASKAPR